MSGEAMNIEAKSVLLKEIWDDVRETRKTGCSFGQVTRQITVDVCRRLGDLEVKFWAIIVLLVANLASVATIIIRGH